MARIAAQQAAAERQLTLTMRATAFTASLAFLFLGFGFVGWNYMAPGRSVAEANLVCVTFLGVTVVMAGFCAALGGLMDWTTFLRIFLREKSESKGG